MGGQLELCPVHRIVHLRKISLVQTRLMYQQTVSTTAVRSKTITGHHIKDMI